MKEPQPLRKHLREHKQEIHKRLKKASPEGVHKAKRLFKFKYPKLFCFILSIILSYYLFSRPEVASWSKGLDGLSYLGIFIAGLFMAFGFSTPFSIGFFLIANPSNIYLASIIAAIGATFGDLIIFKTIRFSFMDEFKRLKKAHVVKKIREVIHAHKRILLNHYLLYVFAGIIIASPLPDEVGVSMLAGLTSIKPFKLAAISFILHVIAAFVIFSLGLAA
jgi:uncharacterized membrane protein YdjX (TVP38/TMEM64 family)